MPLYTGQVIVNSSSSFLFPASWCFTWLSLDLYLSATDNVSFITYNTTNQALPELTFLNDSLVNTSTRVGVVGWYQSVLEAESAEINYSVSYKCYSSPPPKNPPRSSSRCLVFLPLWSGVFAAVIFMCVVHKQRQLQLRERLSREWNATYGTESVERRGNQQGEVQMLNLETSRESTVVAPRPLEER